VGKAIGAAVVVRRKKSAFGIEKVPFLCYDNRGKELASSGRRIFSDRSGTVMAAVLT